MLASGDGESIVKIWDPISGICLQTLSPSEVIFGSVNSLVFSRGGKLAYRTEKSLAVWDVPQEVYLQKLNLEEHIDESIGQIVFRAPSSVAFTNEHKLTLTGGGLSKILTSDLDNECEEQSSSSFDNKHMILSSDGQWVACVIDGRISIFNVSSKANYPPKTLENSRNPLYYGWSACFSLDNRYVASRVGGECVKVWDVSSTACIQTFRGKDLITALAFSQYSQLLGMGCISGNIIIWDWKNCTRLKTFTGHQDPVSSLAFSLNGAWIASASRDRTVKIWDNVTHTFNEESEFGFKTERIRMAMDDERFATLSLGSGNLQVWDHFGSKCITQPLKKKYCQVAISANGGIVAAVLKDKDGDGTGVEIWDVESGDLSTVHSRNYRIRSIALSANGERFIIGFFQGMVEIWESRTGQLLQERQDKQSRWMSSTGTAIFSAETVLSPAKTAISSDGEQIAWTRESSMPERIHTENLDTGALREFQFDNHRVHSLAFSQNGKRLAAISWKWEGAIWDVATGVCLRKFRRGAEQPKPMWDLDTSFLNLDFTEAVDSPVLEESENCLTKYYISPDGAWVMKHGKKLLWILPEYRPGNAAASGSNIAIARASGRPFVIGFSDDGF